MLQYVSSFCVVEGDVAQFYLFFEVVEWFGFCFFFDGVLCFEYVVDAFHGCESHGYHVGLACEVFDGVDDAIEDDHVEDEGGSVDESVAVQYEPSAEEQYDDDDECAHGFGHWVCGVDAHHHADHSFAEFVVDEVEAFGHFLFGDECFDDAQSAECFFYLCHYLGESCLHGGGLVFESFADGSHEPCCGWCDDEDEDGELPADGEECGEADDDGDGLLYECGDG